MAIAFLRDGFAGGMFPSCGLTALMSDFIQDGKEL